MALLAERGEVTAAEFADAVPALREQSVTSPGKPYESRRRVASTVLGVLAAEGRIRRARPAGSWTSARFRWAPAEPLPELPPAASKAALARLYLAVFGPVTEADLKWWTGSTLTATRKAIAATGAEAVDLDEGTGYVLAEDLEPVSDPEPWVALLPGLDPTPMGWRHRDWYLDTEHTPALFDRNGNIGPTVWADGRIIGAWAQRPDGTINHHLFTDPGPETRTAVQHEAARMATFLGDTRVTPCYRTPLERHLSAWPVEGQRRRVRHQHPGPEVLRPRPGVGARPRRGPPRPVTVAGLAAAAPMRTAVPPQPCWPPGPGVLPTPAVAFTACPIWV
ncbi:DNA glycosylase AlkZ-like family protein [Streptomyces sp. NPDC048340]|uniref:DNA glycosylase AlkZ-like family protein n=1 Tax=Streptomyces sp. NPDC048340 TaxID=3365537 RepID=UPI00371FB7E3